MPNLALCEYELPNGRICRQPRLRTESRCRFHIRWQTEHDFDRSMDDLNDELEAMDTPQLLEALRARLENIRCYMRCYPEALLALIVAIDRLTDPGREPSLSDEPFLRGGHSLSAVPSMTGPQPERNQSPPSIHHIPQDLWESLTELMSYGEEDE
ncbi:hypothetical protein HNQ77_000364 [Silvibacterium bohemicum]|uniref:Uncharacterized protein n=1 Tax=Silvibacterium bohemicum TaxID=1577686 RepID=A0A841JM52_9BACT|nr:hypothetical protein [Silvibacterium bohemicum]MBB6142426.1 hypothetical protein [Silvibacterium bohemicum]